MKNSSSFKQKALVILLTSLGLYISFYLVTGVNRLSLVYSSDGRAVTKKLDSLCRLNGGITVFETTSAENELLGSMRLPLIDHKDLRTNINYAQPGTNYTTLIERPEKLISPRFVLNGSSVEIYRHKRHLIRKRDQRIMATAIDYSSSATPLLNPDFEKKDSRFWLCEDTNDRPSTSHSDLRFYVFRPRPQEKPTKAIKLEIDTENSWYSIKDFSNLEESSIQLSFDKTLSNAGTAGLKLQTDRSYTNALFEENETGKALSIQGEGDSVEFKTDNKISLNDISEISFMFQRKQWENPYQNSARLQTITTLSTQSGYSWSHISFGFYSLENLSFKVNFDSFGGSNCQLKTSRQAVTLMWHTVRLRINTIEKTTTLFFDDQAVDTQRCIPTAVHHGINKIKFGTWHKKNQAYKGLIKNFAIKSKLYRRTPEN